MAKSVTTYGNITSGKLNILAGDNRTKFYEAFQDWKDCEVELTVKRIEPNRSNPANRYYWGVVVDIARKVINEEWGESHGRLKIHEILKGENNLIEHETSSHRIIMIPRDTHDMDHSDFCEYVERCRRWLKDFFGADTPDPAKMSSTKTELNA